MGTSVLGECPEECVLKRPIAERSPLVIGSELVTARDVGGGVQ